MQKTKRMACIFLGILFVAVGPLTGSILTNPSFEMGFTGYTSDAFLDFNAALAGAPSYQTFLAAQTDPSRTTVNDSNAVVASQTTAFDGAGTAGSAVLPTNGRLLAFLSNETNIGDGSLTGSSISQTFTIPVGSTTFTFDIALLNDDVAPSSDFNDFGGLALLLGSTVVDQYNLDLAGMANASVQQGVARGGFLNSTPWHSATFDVSGLQGQTVTLVAYVTQAGDNTVESRIVLDNLAVNGSMSAVPEPASVTLALGAVLVCLAVKRSQLRVILRTSLAIMSGAASVLFGATIAVNGTGSPVADGQSLQNAIDIAQPGDVISVQPGFSYQGQITLRAKANPNGNFITIQSAAVASSLPAAGMRTGPAYSAAMPKITTGNGLSAFVTEDAASYYKLVNLEFPPIDANTQLFQMLLLGNGTSLQTTMAQVPQHLVIDRCYFHGFPNTNWKQAIQLNSGNTDIINSYFSDFHSDIQESHDIAVINGPGPFNFINNYFEAAGVNVLFGGAVPAIPGLVPSNILFKGNDFTKNLAYKNWDKVDPATYADAAINHPDRIVFFDGVRITNFLYHIVGAYSPQVKNLLEFKTGQDVIVEGNTFTNCWVQADQFGVPIVVTPRSEGGAAPWATTQRIALISNLFQHTGGAVLVGGDDPGQTAPTTNNVTLYNNLFDDLRTDYSLDFERTFQFTHITNLRLDHNTFLSNFYYQFIVAAPPETPTSGYNFTNNITVYGQGFSSDCGFNVGAFACALAGPYTFTGNIIVGGSPSAFPAQVQATTYLPATVGDVGFVNATALGSDYHNYALAGGTPYKGKGTHGTDPGFNPSIYDIARKAK